MEGRIPIIFECFVCRYIKYIEQKPNCSLVGKDKLDSIPLETITKIPDWCPLPKSEPKQ